jgi:hypothetical protein
LSLKYFIELNLLNVNSRVAPRALPIAFEKRRAPHSPIFKSGEQLSLENTSAKNMAENG